jgi:hypothetical protein
MPSIPPSSSNRCADDLSALLRETPEAAPPEMRLDWFLRAAYAEVMEALVEDGSLLENIRAEMRAARAAAPEEP